MVKIQEMEGVLFQPGICEEAHVVFINSTIGIQIRGEAVGSFFPVGSKSTVIGEVDYAVNIEVAAGERESAR